MYKYNLSALNLSHCTFESSQSFISLCFASSTPLNMNRSLMFMAVIVAIACMTSAQARSARFDEGFDKILSKVTSGLAVAKNGVARFLDNTDSDGILTAVIVVVAIVIFLPLLLLPFAGLLGGISPLAQFQNQGRRRRDVDVDQLWSYANEAVNYLEEAIKKYQ